VAEFKMVDCGAGASVRVEELRIQYNLVYSGINSIPKDYYDAASIDGAGGFKCFTSITLPLFGSDDIFCIYYFHYKFIQGLQRGLPVVRELSAAQYVYAPALYEQ